ncbi:class I SAM-dependent methyltransferase [Treponema sp. R80B11-R83G3]
MKNIINEKPSIDLRGRNKFITQFVSDEDISGKSVLDIGCGYGWFELNAIKRNVGKIVGLELSEKDIETAKNNVHAKNVDFINYTNNKNESVTKLPFEDEQFDTVVSWEVLEHIPKKCELEWYKEIYRVLRGGGVLYISTPNRHLLSNIFDPAWYLIGHRHYSLKDLFFYGEAAGFTVEQHALRGKWWEILSINNLYISKWILRRPQLFKEYFDRKVDNEYNQKSGFTGAFVKYRK